MITITRTTAMHVEEMISEYLTVYLAYFCYDLALKVRVGSCLTSFCSSRIAAASVAPLALEIEILDH
jgi:hypothetical protein